VPHASRSGLAQPARHENGAEDGTRTRDPHLGKVMLYQLSHFRPLSPSMIPRCWCRGPGSNWRHLDFQSSALPTELPRRRSSLRAPQLPYEYRIRRSQGYRCTRAPATVAARSPAPMYRRKLARRARCAGFHRCIGGPLARALRPRAGHASRQPMDRRYATWNARLATCRRSIGAALRDPARGRSRRASECRRSRSPVSRAS
jgi:hypothetical protein